MLGSNDTQITPLVLKECLLFIYLENIYEYYIYTIPPFPLLYPIPPVLPCSLSNSWPLSLESLFLHIYVYVTKPIYCSSLVCDFKAVHSVLDKQLGSDACSVVKKLLQQMETITEIPNLSKYKNNGVGVLSPNRYIYQHIPYS